jgi:DNA-binding beta-propeller fold protein YncE
MTYSRDARGRTTAGLLVAAILTLACLAAASSAWAGAQFVDQWSFDAPAAFDNPHDVATDPAGNVYVADAFNARVQKFDASGAYLGQWGSSGTGNGQFTWAWSIATDSAGNVYVGDRARRDVQKFTSTGAFLTKWGGFGTGDGQFQSPEGIAVDAVGDVYVADDANHRVQKFTSSGAFITKWGTNGTGDGQFNYPTGVAVDPAGDVYVVDSQNFRIQKFTSSGSFITKWGGSFGCGGGQFANAEGITADSSGNVYVANTGCERVDKYSSAGSLLSQWQLQDAATGDSTPSGIAVSGSNVYVSNTGDGRDRIEKYSSSGAFVTEWGTSSVNPAAAASAPDGSVYVTDPNTHRVRRYSATGALLNEWGSRGAGNGQFGVSSPTGVAVDSSGAVYVVDWSNWRVQKFSPTGTFLTAFGSVGSGDGQFNNPQDVAVDAGGNIYVTDAQNQRVQKFSSAGTFLAKWGTFGSGNGQFSGPTGVATDSAGNVYVADRGNRRVQKFDSFGLFLTAWDYGSGACAQPFPQRVDDVAVDAGGRVYVSAGRYRRVTVFTSSGGCLEPFGTLDSQVVNDAENIGLATASPSGQTTTVYAADNTKHDVEVFRYSETGKIVIRKDAIPDDPQDFDFTAGGGLLPASFQLDDDGDNANALSNSREFEVAPGSYSVDEVVPAGWIKSSATCSDGSSITSIQVSIGETVTCTFTNRPAGKIVVQEDSVPDDPQDFTFFVSSVPGFQLDDDSDPTLPNTRTVDVVAGSYSVSESVPSGWYQGKASCDDGSPINNVSVSQNETVTCKFTNSLLYARPGSATPLRVPLVNSYRECTTPDTNHVAPLGSPACTSPTMDSAQLKTRSVGSGSGFVKFIATPGNPSTTTDEADIAVTAQVTDVQRASDSADYSGNLIIAALLRITDQANDTEGVASGTVRDFEFGAPMSCVTTGGPAGSICNLSTTFDTLVPNFAKEGKLAILSAEEIYVKDTGPNGTIAPTVDPIGLGCPPTCGDGDEQRFMQQGVFAP